MKKSKTFQILKKSKGVRLGWAPLDKERLNDVRPVIVNSSKVELSGKIQISGIERKNDRRFYIP